MVQERSSHTPRARRAMRCSCVRPRALGARNGAKRAHCAAVDVPGSSARQAHALGSQRRVAAMDSSHTAVVVRSHDAATRRQSRTGAAHGRTQRGTRRAQPRNSAQMGKAHVDSCCHRTMPTMPDAHAQALVPADDAALRALLAGNCNRRLSSQDSRKPRTMRVGNAAPVNMFRRENNAATQIMHVRSELFSEFDNARTAPQSAT